MERSPRSLKGGRGLEWVKLLESASLRKALLQSRPETSRRRAASPDKESALICV